MPKKKDDAPAWQLFKELFAELRGAPSLQDAVTILAKAKGQVLPRPFYCAALGHLATRVGTSKGSTSAVEAGELLLSQATAMASGEFSEANVTCMVRIYCSSGKQSQAVDLIARCISSGIKLKLRTLSAVLVRAAEVEDRVTVERIWKQILDLGMHPQETEFAAMLRGMQSDSRRQVEVLELLTQTLSHVSDPPLVQAIGRAFGVSDVVSLQQQTVRTASGREDAGKTWHVGWSGVNEDGVCKASGGQLQALDISEAEEETLRKLAARLAIEGAPDQGRGFQGFHAWLQTRDPFDVIVDGANVGYNNQNREGGEFQYGQIDQVVNHLKGQGKKTLVVLHPKWLRDDVDVSVRKRKRQKLARLQDYDTPPAEGDEEPEADESVVFPHDPVTEAERKAEAGTRLGIIRKWKESGVLATVPVAACDDWYWLYAALDSAARGVRAVQVVSNDLMRDHHWRMMSRETFLRWRDRHLTRVSIWRETPATPGPVLALLPPRAYSFRAQRAKDAWYFPVPKVASRAEQVAAGHVVSHRELGAAEYSWLVAWLQ
mmetsp:Transcript_2741/g.6217  ORF Transcript_2741/g.6217 Transcript_2741/m.6217 type:complete len:545 (+) Transcript_2741:15-1649(+)